MLYNIKLLDFYVGFLPQKKNEKRGKIYYYLGHKIRDFCGLFHIKIKRAQSNNHNNDNDDSFRPFRIVQSYPV